MWKSRKVGIQRVTHRALYIPQLTNFTFTYSLDHIGKMRIKSSAQTEKNNTRETEYITDGKMYSCWTWVKVEWKYLMEIQDICDKSQQIKVPLSIYFWTLRYFCSIPIQWDQPFVNWTVPFEDMMSKRWCKFCIFFSLYFCSISCNTVCKKSNLTVHSFDHNSRYNPYSKIWSEICFLSFEIWHTEIGWILRSLRAKNQTKVQDFILHFHHSTSDNNG